jgi:hypothetical protein
MLSLMFRKFLSIMEKEMCRDLSSVFIYKVAFCENTHDSHTFGTSLGWLGWHNINRMFSICVRLPKGAKANVVIVTGNFAKKLRQCTRSFKNNLIAILTVENKYCHYMKVALQLL